MICLLPYEIWQKRNESASGREREKGPMMEKKKVKEELKIISP